MTGRILLDSFTVVIGIESRGIADGGVNLRSDASCTDCRISASLLTITAFTMLNSPGFRTLRCVEITHVGLIIRETAVQSDLVSQMACAVEFTAAPRFTRLV